MIMSQTARLLILSRAKAMVLVGDVPPNLTEFQHSGLTCRKILQVILLHGPPGTGKTLTAESVAEYSKRPLYRLTSGDIGTNPEDVEKSLEHIFYLGNTWKPGQFFILILLLLDSPPSSLGKDT